MPERRRTSSEEHKTTSTLRRSPRLFHRNQIFVENPKTQELAVRKTGIDLFSAPPHSPIAVTHKNGCRVSNCSKKSDRIPGSSPESNSAANLSGFMKKRVTRSSTLGARPLHNDLNRCAEILDKENGKVTESQCRAKNEEIMISEKQLVAEKRVTRSSLPENKSGRVSGSSPGLNSMANLNDFVEKRVTRSSTRRARPLHNGLNHCSEILDNEDAQVTELKCRAKNEEIPILGKQHATTKSFSLNQVIEKMVTRSSLEEKTPPTTKFFSLKQVIEKRVTRSSLQENKSAHSDPSLDKDFSTRISGSSNQAMAEVGIDFYQKSRGNTEERGTRVAQSFERADKVSTHRACKVAVSEDMIRKGDGGEKREAEERKCGRRKPVGVKRKRYRLEGDCEFNREWSDEQELALRRAYFLAKPTPDFWKKVAKMVPGKSAKECFDRIHYDHITPPQRRTRSRANNKEPSPVSYSASQLLLRPAVIKPKKLKPTRKKLMAQKTVRHLLEKQCNQDNKKADLFSVLEPDVELSSPVFRKSPPFTSPVLAKCHEMPSLAHKKPLSRLSCLQQAAFASPPVLKQIKNKALHDKYIDQLHCRDARRKAESLRNSKRAHGENYQMESHSQMNLVKVAKDALIFDAQDAIVKFRNLQSCANLESDDDDEITDDNVEI